MSVYFKAYIFSWIIACLYSVFLCIKYKSNYAFLYKGYWVFLFKPWKSTTFVIAALGLTVIAPYTGDYTWDYYDTSLMSILTFLTAPWAVGIFYKFREKKASLKQIFVAFCVWMLSASWSYDIYMYFRTGEYPPTWWSNIVLSSFLYISAGLMWNLDWEKEKRVFMSFKEDNWPKVSRGRVFPKIIVATLPFVLIVIILSGLVIYNLRFSN